MAEKALKSIDISSYTIIATGVATLFSILVSIILVGAFAIAVPNSFGVMMYIVPTIVFGTIISCIFLYFSQAYLYNTISKRFGFIKFDIEGDYIKKISTKETALIIGTIMLIIILVVYLAISLIFPLFLSSLMSLLMYASQTDVAALFYQVMFVISNPVSIATGIIGSVIITTVFVLLGTYIYNILGDSERGILVKLTTEDNITQLDSITPLNFAIALGAISLILNIILAIVLVISGAPLFNALIDVIIGFAATFVEALIIAVFYNFLAPKLGKLKVELD